MRVVQTIFSSPTTHDSGLDNDNKVFGPVDVIERVKKDIDLGVKEFLLFYIPDYKLKEKNNFVLVSQTAKALAKLNI